MRTHIPKQNPDDPLNEFIDRDPSSQGVSRRRFLAGAAAASMAAFVAPGEVLAAAQGERYAEDPVWKDVKLEKEDDKTIVVCDGPGDRCVILRLVNAKRLSPFHDAELVKCTIAINAIFDELITRNRVRTRHPGLIVTPHIPFLAWMQPSRNPGAGGGLRLEDNPERFYQELGISLEAYRDKPTRFWYSIGGNKCGCKKPGDTQKVARLLEAQNLSSVHDAELRTYTNRVNAILDDCARRRRDPKDVLSLMVTPKGLFLAWSQNDDSEGPLPRGAITALHEKELIYQALGI